MKNNAEIYGIVLKNISKSTYLDEKTDLLISQFNKEIDKQEVRSEDYWQAKAYADFHHLLNEEIKTLQELQKDCIDRIIFKIR